MACDVEHVFFIYAVNKQVNEIAQYCIDIHNLQRLVEFKSCTHIVTWGGVNKKTA